MKAARLTYIALLSAIAIIFGYVESLFPLPVPIPGVKLGLSNIVILYAIIKMNKTDAFLIMLIKITVCSLLFSGMSGFIYSLSGGILSIIAMIAAVKASLSTIGASIAGGIMHNVGQLLAASIMLKSLSVFYYLPVLLLSGILVGFITGAVCASVMRKLK